jgi:MoaA/NifB/PqqE/SkfB family radical SAM enzyme
VQFNVTLAEPLGELVFTNANLIKKGRDMDFDFSQEKTKKRKSKGLSKFFVKCLDCRAFIGDAISDRYPTCPFCNGANWSNDV